MHADDRRELKVAPDGDGFGQGVDAGLLCAVAVGASIEEIAARLAAVDLPIDPYAVARVMASLERRGLLRAGTRPEGASHVPTERGRQMILDQG